MVISVTPREFAAISKLHAGKSPKLAAWEIGIRLSSFKTVLFLLRQRTGLSTLQLILAYERKEIEMRPWQGQKTGVIGKPVRP